METGEQSVGETAKWGDAGMKDQEPPVCPQGGKQRSGAWAQGLWAEWDFLLNQGPSEAVALDTPYSLHKNCS